MESNLRVRLKAEIEQIQSWNPPQCCRRNCVEKIGIHKCRLLRKQFFESSQTKRKSDLLSMRVTLTSVSSAQGAKYGIESDGVLLCTRFLVTVLNVHQQLQSSVLKRPSALNSDIPGRQLDSSSSGTFEKSVVAFLRALADEVGDEMPHNAERHLPHRSKKVVYMLYCESERQKHEPFCTRSHFYATWKALVPHIKCRKSHAFAICDTCLSFRERLMHIARKSSRDRERSQLLDGFRNHLKKVKLERAEYARNRLLAIEHPDTILSVIIDGADQSKFGIPRFLDKSKSETGFSIKQKLTGVLFHGGLGRDDFLAYLTSPENLPAGANQTIDAFARCFLVLLEYRAFKNKMKKPETLFIQLDNTTKDNKNRYVMAFCDWLVHQGIFKTIHVNFLPVGHTHEDIDRKFSRLSVSLSCQDTITLQDLHRAIRGSVLGTNKPHVARVLSHNDFSNALENQKCVARTIPNFSSYRKFVFQRESVVDLRSPRIVYNVSCRAAVSMTVAKADWERLPTSSGHIGSFLISEIVLGPIQPTPFSKISAAELSQMRKRVHSAESRIRNRSKVEELMREIESLENCSATFPGWTFQQLLESCDDSRFSKEHSDGSESEDEQGYTIGGMITVRHTKSNAATPFWVAAITNVDVGQRNSVEVSWYELVPEDAATAEAGISAKNHDMGTVSSYSGRYRPCFSDESMPLRDVISTRSILVSFSALTSANTLSVLVQKLTRQALDPFSEEDKDEESEEEDSEKVTRDDHNEDSIEISKQGARIEVPRSSRVLRDEHWTNKSNEETRGKRAKSASELHNVQKRRKNNDLSMKTQELNIGYFVAVYCPTTKTADPFWIAQVEEVSNSRNGTAKKVKVLWYSPRNENERWNFETYSESAFDATDMEDIISEKSVAWTFPNLSAKNKIPRREIMNIRKALKV